MKIYRIAYHDCMYCATHWALIPLVRSFDMWMKLVEDSGLQKLSGSGGTESLTEMRRYRRTMCSRCGGHLETVTETVIRNSKVLSTLSVLLRPNRQPDLEGDG